MGLSDAQRNNTNLNVFLICWRYNHSHRLVPQGVEASHLAEAYHRSNTFLPGHRVELSELEAREVNESRKVCSLFGLMWRKPDGSVIKPIECWPLSGVPTEDTYQGHTMCMHSVLGSPCYGPYVNTMSAPTFLTPIRLSVGSRGRKRKESGGLPSTPTLTKV